MTKKLSRARQLLSLFLSFAMVLTLLVPAMAWAAPGEEEGEGGTSATGYTISIYPNDHTYTPPKEEGSEETVEEIALKSRFLAYAIFAGELNGTVAGDNVNKQPKASQLGNIVWGSGIKAGDNGKGYSDLLAALCNDTTTLKDLGLTAEVSENFKNLNKKYEKSHEEINGDSGVTTTTTVYDFQVIETTTLGQLFTRALQMEGYTLKDASNDITGEYDEVSSVEAGTSGDTGLKKSAAYIAGVISKVNEDSGTASPSNNNSKLANAFANIVAKHSDATKENGKVYTYLSNEYTTSTWVYNGEGNEAIDGAHWEISGLSRAGYYLIIDTYNNLNPDLTTELDEISDYMLAVLDDQDIYLKSNAADVKKTVDNTENANGILTTEGDNAVSAEVGDTVTFHLTGTLSENFPNYSFYKFIFHDTLSKGLTFNADSIKVYAVDTRAGVAENEIKKYEILAKDTEVTLVKDGTDSEYKVLEKEGYTLTTGTDDDGNATIDIAFADLMLVKYLNVTNEENISFDKINIEDNSWEIRVEYTATVNKDAAVINPDDDKFTSNLNKVKLEYSNDVNDEGSTGTTTEKTVYVHVFGLNMLKTDGVSASALSGAQFSLTKKVTEYIIVDANGANSENVTPEQLAEILGVTTEDINPATLADTYKDSEKTFSTGNYPDCAAKYKNYYIKGTTETTYYALFTKTEGGDYIIDRWIKATTVEDFIDTAQEWTWGNNITYTNGNTLGLTATDTGDYYLSITTTDKAIKIKGLDEGEYILTEEFTPAGYDTMKPVTLVIKREIGDDGTLTSLTIQHKVPDNMERNDVLLADAQSEVINKEVTSTEGYIDVTLKNMPSGYLPGTGGLGTVLFYTGGAVMLAIGGLYILRRKRRNASAI